MAIAGYNIRAKAACQGQLSMYLYGYKNIAELNKFNRLTLFWEELLFKMELFIPKNCMKWEGIALGGEYGRLIDIRDDYQICSLTRITLLTVVM
jgi:hypothetical protein